MKPGKLTISTGSVSRFDACIGATMVFRMGGEAVITVGADGDVEVLGKRVPNLVTEFKAWRKPESV